MKLLKLKLGDDKVYTFKTFSALQQKSLAKESKVYNNLNEELRTLNYEIVDGKAKLDNEGNWIPRLFNTQEEKKRKEEIQDTMFDFTVDVFRKSICGNHPEFIKVEDKIKDNEKVEKLLSIVDMQDLRAITQFAMTGSYVKEEDILDFSEFKSEE